MNQKRLGYYKGLFFIAAVYDIVLGIIFTLFYKPAYSLLGISLPSYPGYLSLIGAFLLVIGIAYALIYTEIKKKRIFNRDLIKVGTLYKLAYALVAFGYLAFGTLPHLSFAYVFGVADVIFMILFIECLNYIR